MTFFRFLLAILIAETLSLVVAWSSVKSGTNRWIQAQSAQLVQIVDKASHADWSLVDRMPAGKDSKIFDRYADRLDALSARNFARKEGAVYLILIRNGEELDILSGDPIPLDDVGKANAYALKSFNTGVTTWTPVPISDNTGTYLAAYTPIRRDGKVIGLVAAERDTAPLGDIQDIVRSAFWYAVIPAIVLPIVLAFILARIFVEPMSIFRTIEERAKRRRAHGSAEHTIDQRWDSLTVTEKKIAELARQGLTVKEMAAVLASKPNTVSWHLRQIRGKTGWQLRDLALEASVRWSASVPPRTI